MEYYHSIRLPRAPAPLSANTIRPRLCGPVSPSITSPQNPSTGSPPWLGTRAFVRGNWTKHWDYPKCKQICIILAGRGGGGGGGWGRYLATGEACIASHVFGEKVIWGNWTKHWKYPKHCLVGQGYLSIHQSIYSLKHQSIHSYVFGEKVIWGNWTKHWHYPKCKQICIILSGG